MNNIENNNIAKPFIKWAGGKSQILPTLIHNLPKSLTNPNYQEEFTYIEPFVGGGALLFHVLQSYPNVKHSIINDDNQNLINAYLTIKYRPAKLLITLKSIQKDFLPASQDDRKIIYNKIRLLYNQNISDNNIINNIEQAAFFIFLNKTCFNGLYRVNKKNHFNVPMGSYDNPNICDTTNILNVHKILTHVTIISTDFKNITSYIPQAFSKTKKFFYFDPPYKPTSPTSSFTKYSKEGFSTINQSELAFLTHAIHNNNDMFLLSNSSSPSNDKFFEHLYDGFDIKHVDAKRSINSNPSKRGKIKELLICNY